MENLGFELPDGLDAYQLAVEVGERQVIEIEQPVFEDLTLYDTFDWRLLRQSLVLYRSDDTLILRSLDDGEVLHSLETSVSPGFAWNLSEGGLKARLAPILEMRKLIGMAELQVRSTALRVLNRNQKTVARLVHEEMQISPEEGELIMISYVWVWPVRGYPRYFRDLVNYFKGIGLPTCTFSEIQNRVLEASGKVPGEYSTKLNVQLAPGARSDDAMKAILRFLLQIIRCNVAGIQDDIDTEFLHDYRVAIRRTRSALTQVKGVFPSEAVEAYKQEFASLGQLTNPLRDLDVYLLKESAYRAMLPLDLQDGISPLFERLRSQRSQVLQDVIRGLDSENYERFLQDWEAFLEEQPGDSSTALNAARPIISVAQERIYKRYQSILKTGRELLKHTDDDRLHALRIECKKLRYLLEFFISLFPRKKIDLLVAQLKKLQDNLGDFNDLCVQIEYLLDVATEIPLEEACDRDMLLAIGCLVGRLESEKQVVKDAFAATFTHFAAPANRRLFRQLFAS